MWNQIADIEKKLRELRGMRTGNTVTSAPSKEELLLANGLQPLYATAVRHIDSAIGQAIVDAEAGRPINPNTLRELKAFRAGFGLVREM